MKSSVVNPKEFSGPATRRIRAFAASARAPVVAGAGWDGHGYVWNVGNRELVYDSSTTTESGGVSLALDATGSTCFVGTYYAWGAACLDLSERRELWRRTDLKRFYGLTALPDDASIVSWFDGRAAEDSQANMYARRRFLVLNN